MLILKGGKIQYMAPMRHFKPSTYNRWLSWIFFGTSNPSEIPEKLSGIWRSDSWALRACRNFRRAMLSSTREPNLGLKLLHVCRPKYFHGSRAYALMVLGEEEKVQIWEACLMDLCSIWPMAICRAHGFCFVGNGCRHTVAWWCVPCQ